MNMMHNLHCPRCNYTLNPHGTRRQLELLDFIISIGQHERRMPTLAEAATALGVSRQAVDSLLDGLVRHMRLDGPGRKHVIRSVLHRNIVKIVADNPRSSVAFIQTKLNSKSDSVAAALQSLGRSGMLRRDHITAEERFAQGCATQAKYCWSITTLGTKTLETMEAP